MYKNKIVAIFLGISFLCQSIPVGAVEIEKPDPVRRVFKIISYSFDEINDAYIHNSYGSAVLIDKNTIITNAHVVLDSDKKPVGNYNLCVSESFRTPPKCLSALKLIRYDTENDLALLKPVENIDLGAPVVMDDRELNLGEGVRVYGYPENGGKTITMTEGKISGMEKEHYKIDANIDSGNSGGGAFDASGNFIGIPYVASVGLSTLGYIIPVSTIKDFLLGKTQTESYEKTDEAFLRDVMRGNKIEQTGDVNNAFVKLSGFSSMGFHIESVLENRDGKIASYTYSTKDDKTWITLDSIEEYGSSFFDVLSDEVLMQESKERNLSIIIRRNVVLKGMKIPRMILRRGYIEDDGTKNENYLSIQFSLPGVVYKVATDDFTKEKKNVVKGISLLIKNYPNLKLRNPSVGIFEHMGIKFQTPENMNLYRVIDDEGSGIQNYLTISSFGKAERNEGIVRIRKFPLGEDEMKDLTNNDIAQQFFIGVYKGMLGDMEKEEKDYDISREIRQNKQGHKYIMLAFRSKETGRIYRKSVFLFMKGNNMTGVMFDMTGDSDSRVTGAYNAMIDSVIIPGEFPFPTANIGKIEIR